MVNMFEYGENKGSFCYFHPKEMVVGVCCMCLNERLLILASNQEKSFTQFKTKIRNKNNYKSFSKIFSFTNYLVHRFEFRHREPLSKINYEDTDDDDNNDVTSTSSQEDSFISIKFENNGDASWEKRNFSLENDSKDVKASTSVVKHAKSRGPSLRWRKRIGYFFQVMRWKRSSQGNVGHVAAKLEGVKVRSGWMRSLTKRRTK